jgi:hypothetical protein
LRTTEKSFVHGKVIYENGAAVKSAVVKVKGASLNALTNAQGMFSMEVALPNRKLDLIVKIGRISREISLGDVPTQPVDVEVVLVITRLNNADDDKSREEFTIDLKKKPNIRQRPKR